MICRMRFRKKSSRSVWRDLWQHQAAISAARLQRRVGKIETVLIDEVVEEGAVARSKSDAPEIDGQVFIDGATHLQVGDFVEVEIEEADEYDLWGAFGLRI